MASRVTLLQLSPTMTEGTLVKWLVKEGDKVSDGQAIAEVETDKAVMEQTSFENGTILKLTAKEGDKVPVGNVIAVIGKPGEDASALAGAPAAAPKKAESAPKKAAPVAPAPAPEAPKPAPAAPAPAAPAAPAPAAASGERVLASPLARKIAKDAGIELSGIDGSGPQGRVVKADVEAALSKPAAPAPAPVAAPAAAVAAPVEGAEVVALSGMRQTIARRLQESKQTIPHFQLTVDVRGEKVLEAVERVRKAAPDSKVTVTHFLIKAMANVGMRHKAIRSQWAGNAIQIIPGSHISVAVAIEEGLVTPVIRNAHTKGVLQLATELRQLAELARARKLKAEDMSGGTQTISNLGMFGIKEFTAIVNPPEASILAIGAMEDRPVVENGQVVAGKVMTITMSSDHRIIDGAVGAQFLSDLKKALEDPLLMLL